MKIHRLFAATLVLAAASPAFASEPGDKATSDASSLLGSDSPSATTSSPSSQREAALRTTIEKRKQKRARARMAYNRTSAQASAMMAAYSPRPPMYGMRSVGPGSQMVGSNVFDASSNNGGPAYFQANGQVGAGDGSYLTGGAAGGGSPCSRR